MRVLKYEPKKLERKVFKPLERKFKPKNDTVLNPPLESLLVFIALVFICVYFLTQTTDHNSFVEAAQQRGVFVGR